MTCSTSVSDFQNNPFCPGSPSTPLCFFFDVLNLRVLQKNADIPNSLKFREFETNRHFRSAHRKPVLVYLLAFGLPATVPPASGGSPGQSQVRASSSSPPLWSGASSTSVQSCSQSSHKSEVMQKIIDKTRIENFD